MKPHDKYHKICPTCGEEFEANHMLRIYCDEDCKREASRAKKEEIRNQLNEDKLALKENDSKLGKLFLQKKSHYTKLDLDNVQFDPNCYYHRYQVENTIKYVLDRFILKELQERTFKIYKLI